MHCFNPSAFKGLRVAGTLQQPLTDGAVFGVRQKFGRLFDAWKVFVVDKFSRFFFDFILDIVRRFVCGNFFLRILCNLCEIFRLTFGEAFAAMHDSARTLAFGARA